MRFHRYGLPVALVVTAALGAYFTYPGNDALAGALGQASRLASGADPQLEPALSALIDSAEVGPADEVRLDGIFADERFLTLDSGRYWQISGKGHKDFASRSLGNRRLEVSGRKAWAEPFRYSSEQFPDEPLAVVGRTIRLPGSEVEWQFLVAGARDSTDRTP